MPKLNAIEHVAALTLAAQVACPIVLGEAGLWTDNPARAYLRLADGSDVDLSTGGASTGNFEFDGNQVDLSASAQMTIGGANTTRVNFNIAGEAIGYIYDPGDGGFRINGAVNVALHGGVTDVIVDSSGVNVYGDLLMQSGTRVDSRTASALTLGGGNATSIMGKIGSTERLTAEASYSRMYSPTQTSYFSVADTSLRQVVNGVAGAWYKDGSGVAYIPDTDVNTTIKSGDVSNTAWMTVRQSQAHLVCQGGTDGFKAANGEVYVTIGNQNGLAVLANTTKVSASGHEGVHVQWDGSDTKLGFLGATPVARQATPVLLADVIAILQAFGLCS